MGESHEEQMRFALDGLNGLRLGFSAVSAAGTFGPFALGPGAGGYLANIDTITGQVLGLQSFLQSGANFTVTGVDFRAGQTTFAGQFGSDLSADGMAYSFAGRPLVSLGNIDQYLMRLDR